MLVFNKIYFGEKNINCNKFKTLYILIPKTIAYVKSFDGKTKWMYFLIEDDDLLFSSNQLGFCS